MNSTRAQIVEVRKATNKPPYRQQTTKANQFYDATKRTTGNRKALLAQARQLAKGTTCTS